MNALQIVRKSILERSEPERDRHAELIGELRHEFNTPLTSIRAFSEILLNNPDMDPVKRKQFLRIVIAETDKLTRRLGDALDDSDRAAFVAGHPARHASLPRRRSART
jgi:signal transduction histidine kinase